MYLTPSIQPVKVTNFCLLLSLSATVTNFLPSSPVATIKSKVRFVIVTVDRCYQLSFRHRVTVTVNTYLPSKPIALISNRAQRVTVTVYKCHNSIDLSPMVRHLVTVMVNLDNSVNYIPTSHNDLSQCPLDSPVKSSIRIDIRPKERYIESTNRAPQST